MHRKRVLPATTHLLITSLFVGSGPCASSARIGDNESGDIPRVVSVLTRGTWGWTQAEELSCAENPHTFSFSGDFKSMTLRQTKDTDMVTGGLTAVYEVRNLTNNGLRGAIVGEPRRTPAGEPFVWDLVLTSDSSYRWRATHWAQGAYTGEIVQCPPNASWQPAAE